MRLSFLNCSTEHAHALNYFATCYVLQLLQNHLTNMIIRGQSPKPIHWVYKCRLLTTSSRLTAWPLCGLARTGGWPMALSPPAPSSPLFSMPLQFPVPPSVCSLTEALWEPLAAACRVERETGSEDVFGILLKDERSGTYQDWKCVMCIQSQEKRLNQQG